MKNKGKQHMKYLYLTDLFILLYFPLFFSLSKLVRISLVFLWVEVSGNSATQFIIEVSHRWSSVRSFSLRHFLHSDSITFFLFASAFGTCELLFLFVDCMFFPPLFVLIQSLISADFRWILFWVTCGGSADRLSLSLFHWNVILFYE